MDRGSRPVFRPWPAGVILDETAPLFLGGTIEEQRRRQFAGLIVAGKSNRQI
jgi:hypothetical protein